MDLDSGQQPNTDKGGMRPVDELVECIETLSVDELTEDEIRTVERAFVDTCGVILSGMSEPPTRVAIDTLAEPGSAPLWGAGRSVATTDAAFIHGIAGHSQDYDDVSWGISGHPSVTMVPAILALAAGNELSGALAIEAYVAGFEAQCFLAAAINPSHYRGGWHATGTFGTFGAAAAGAKVLDLDADATRHALNVAASMAAGVKQNFGTMAKPMHVGNAARSGVTAARLAAGGFTAAPDAIDGDRGFLELYAGEDPVSYADLPDLERPNAVAIHDINVKKYPCCYYTHTSIHATENLVAERGIDPADVESVRVTTASGAGDALHYPNPDTGLEAKFSLEYTVASAAVRPHVGVEAFEDGSVDDAAVQRVRELVQWTIDDSLEYNDSTASVRIETADSTYERVQEVPPGDPANPLSDDELAEKFHRCAGRALPEAVVTSVRERLDSLRSVADVGAIVTE
ncbi:MmgE/PrpD family protein [Natronorarus salvus]|uniref:MmgE/PrpD family protein n=1 Tax=Natronorarus salvus TaxID=3117733 RepID=UPI002F265B08